MALLFQLAVLAATCVAVWIGSYLGARRALRKRK